LKKKVFSLTLIAILILLILLAVFYTWPRTLHTLTDGKTTVSVLASTDLTNFQHGQPQTDRWSLTDEQKTDPSVVDHIMELAGGIRYRRSLRSLFRPDYLEGDYQRLAGNTDLLLVFADGTYIHLTHLGTAAGFTGDESDGFVLATVVNEEALAALSDYIMEIGEKK